ncbi:MAG: CRISPR-associated endoribonuclease Cas6 [bacterium]
MKGRKAFTLSPLFVSRGRAWFRVSFLEDRFFPSFTQYFLKHPVPVVSLDTAELHVEEVITLPDGWSGYATYEELLAGARPETELTLEFKSPTAFRQGDLVLPLPMPKLVFQSYLERWEQFSPVALLPDLIERAERGLGVARHRIWTRPFFDGHGLVPGFVGRVTFIIKGLDKEVVRQLNVLADYAFYAGTGWKTTHGMGLTR